MKWILVLVALAATGSRIAFCQSADWQQVIWREPQVRYLLADMTGGGNVAMYRKYATEERDPDSREAFRLWDSGVRVVNMEEFERKWLANEFGKDGRVLRVVFKGTERTISGNEVLLSNDGEFQQSPMRLVLLDLTLGAKPKDYESKKSDPATDEALRRWREGCRATNAAHFAVKFADNRRHLVFKESGMTADGARVTLNSDVAYPETNVRYFMADIALGGSIEFYRRAAERDHEMGCLEAVRRTEEGYKIANLDEFERKRVDGKTLITRKGSNDRISGYDVKLTSDAP
jgi:hypothetical protein